MTGLNYAGRLPVPCWQVFNPAPTLAATQAAVDVLTRPSRVSVMSAAAASGAAAGELTELHEQQQGLRAKGSTYHVRVQVLSSNNF